MALDLSYITDNDRVDIRLSQADWEILGILGQSCSRELDVLTGVQDFGKARQEKGVVLLRALETLLVKFGQDSETLPYVYDIAIVDGPLAGSSGSGRISGLRLKGDQYYYSIEGGVGRCALIKKGVGPDGWGYDLETKDIRGLDSLETENMGRIKIARKKKGTGLKKALMAVKEFLSRHAEDNVTKVLG